MLPAMIRDLPHNQFLRKEQCYSEEKKVLATWKKNTYIYIAGRKIYIYIYIYNIYEAIYSL